MPTRVENATVDLLIPIAGDRAAATWNSTGTTCGAPRRYDADPPGIRCWRQVAPAEGFGRGRPVQRTAASVDHLKARPSPGAVIVIIP